MPSTFTWLDYSDQDRSRMLDVISQFGERTTRDELGIGTVRDAFADALFPGTSTIQTRARYFLITAWMYREIERVQMTRTGRSRREESISGLARQREHEITEALLRSDDAAGVFGARARGQLKRLPSSVYWQGLLVWGIRTYAGTQSQYYRAIDRLQPRSTPLSSEDSADEIPTPPPNWHGALPGAPPEFPQTISFQLSAAEAEYLQDRIQCRASGTLLAFLVEDGRYPAQVTFPWLHPEVAAVSPKQRELLTHARNFSEVIHSASLLYNLLLAEKTQRADWIEQYRSLIEDWFERAALRRAELENWDRDGRFWDIVLSANPRVHPQTRRFIGTWLKLALEAVTATGFIENQEARKMIVDRERRLKGSLARLKNHHALELWNGDVGAGTTQLSYRWSTVETLVNDILAGLPSSYGILKER